jgi:hypothetical protein
MWEMDEKFDESFPKTPPIRCAFVDGGEGGFNLGRQACS